MKRRPTKTKSKRGPTAKSDRPATVLQARAAAELELRTRTSKTFTSFISAVNKKYIHYRHCLDLQSVAERVVAGELKRVMIFMPPRHSKSETASRLLPSYYLARHPEKTVGLVSYSAELAYLLSRDARDNYLRSGFPTREDVSAAREWKTKEGGGMWSSGIGGSITGKGADLIIIDDPVKNSEEAYSPKIRSRNKEWWKSTLYTRLEPNAAIVFIMTRWHDDDLAGWLLNSEDLEDETPWYIVNMPAIKEPINPNQFPKRCTVHPDDRREGEALCPERYDIGKLENLKRNSGVFWHSLYQQHPTKEGGTLWMREHFEPFKLGQEPELYDVGVDWDLAYTKNDANCASAYLKAGVSSEGDLFVLDLDWRWLEFPEQLKWMRTITDPQYIEAKASGKSAAQTLQSEGIYAEEVEVQGADKISRAKLATAIVSQRERRIHVASHIIDKLLDDPRQGVLRFPAGEFDDLNDTLVQSVNRLARGEKVLTPQTKRNITIKKSESSRIAEAF